MNTLMKLAQINKQSKVHAVYRKGKPTMTYCSMYLWNYIASEGAFENVDCNKCLQAIQKIERVDKWIAQYSAKRVVV